MADALGDRPRGSAEDAPLAQERFGGALHVAGLRETDFIEGWSVC
jgi:hypothetical protein